MGTTNALGELQSSERDLSANLSQRVDLDDF